MKAEMTIKNTGSGHWRLNVGAFCIGEAFACKDVERIADRFNKHNSLLRENRKLKRALKCQTK